MTRSQDSNTPDLSQWLLTVTDLVVLFAPTAIALIKKALEGKKDRFLNYDVDFLLKAYSDETPVFEGVPYSELVDFLGLGDTHIVIDTRQQPFRLKRGRQTETWRVVADAGYEALKSSGRISTDRNDRVVRLTKVTKMNKGVVQLTVQKATYHDQARSNLILDYVALPDNPDTTLRQQLAQKYGRRLPPLSEPRLANNVGVACLLFYREAGRYVPYLVKRVGKVGVMPGGIHCTASGAAEWPGSNGCSFDEYFTCDMFREIEEEIGLKKSDIEDLRLVALCREFLRAGKPQLFFAGITSLSREELRERRKNAAKVIENTSGWPEIARDRWGRSADVVIPADALASNIRERGMTIEGMASLLYGKRYLETFVAGIPRGLSQDQREQTARISSQ